MRPFSSISRTRRTSFTCLHPNASERELPDGPWADDTYGREKSGCSRIQKREPGPVIRFRRPVDQSQSTSSHDKRCLQPSRLNVTPELSARCRIFLTRGRIRCRHRPHSSGRGRLRSAQSPAHRHRRARTGFQGLSFLNRDRRSAVCRYRLRRRRR